MPVAETAALCWLAMCGAGLVVTDLRHHRLPVRRTWTLAGGLATLHGLAVALGDDATRLAWATAGSVLLGILLLVVHLFDPDGLGGGDVRLAVPVGWQVGWSMGNGVVVGMAVVLALAALVTVGGGLVVRRGRLGRAPLPFGPGLLVAVLLVAVGAR